MPENKLILGRTSCDNDAGRIEYLAFKAQFLKDHGTVPAGCWIIKEEIPGATPSRDAIYAVLYHDGQHQAYVDSAKEWASVTWAKVLHHEPDALVKTTGFQIKSRRQALE